jgi:hypothetical protein
MAKEEELSGWDSEDENAAAEIHTVVQDEDATHSAKPVVASGWDSDDDADAESPIRRPSDGSVTSALHSSSSGTPSTKLRKSVSFKEAPEEITVIVDENEQAAWDVEEDVGPDGALPADMSALLKQCEDDDDEDDDDNEPNDWDEAEPVILTQKSTEPSNWDSDDGADDVGQPTQSSQERKRVGQAKTVPAKNVQPIQLNLSATGELDDLLGAILGGENSSASSTPFRGSDSHGFVPGLHCIGCDFQVLRIEHYTWSKEANYMFFRNNYPNVMKLRKNLARSEECTAYCCQCSWKSADAKASIGEIAEGLRWKQISN